MIRKKPLRRLKIGSEERLVPPVEYTDDFKEPDTWTIITALDRILAMAQDSQLSDEFWESVKNPLAFLSKELELTDEAFYIAETISVLKGNSIFVYNTSFIFYFWGS